MPRKAYPGKEVKGGAMGQSLLNKRKNAHYKRQASTQYAGLHVSDSAIDGGSGRLASVTDRHELDEFLCDALLKESEFEVQHSSTVILTTDVVVKPKGDHELFEYQTIPIPRRPQWDNNTTHEDLDRAERAAFMDWRRTLAVMEESTDERQLTPFEKNLEVWKQLWRVLERSHIVVQILDARNPLLFRSLDMEKYVKELDEDKTCLLVINKADYLTPQARKMWAEYFTSHNIDFVFWSAALEQARLDDVDRVRRRKEERYNYHGHNIDRVDLGKIKGAESEEEEEESEDEDEERDTIEDEDDAKVNTLKASSLWKAVDTTDADAVNALSISSASAASASSSSSAAPASSSSSSSSSAAAASSSSSSSSSAPAPSVITHSILTRDELFAYIIAKYCASSAANKERYDSGERITVGMTGYPNVGKSSTINVLAGAKKVTVGATPGKTKHFQTINVDERIALCDCPGLVFPTFLSSRAELVCNGIMPIDQIKDWANIWAPVQLLCEKVSRSQIQQTYSLIFPKYKEIGADELLNSYARMRSFYKDHGRPDDAHAARIILKDFAGGKLLYCHPPPQLTFASRRAFYRSFQVGGAVMIHESLWVDPSDLELMRAEQVADSVRGLGAQDKKDEEAGIVGMRIQPVQTKKKLQAKQQALEDKQRRKDEAAGKTSRAMEAARKENKEEEAAEANDDDDDEDDDEDEDDDDDDDDAVSVAASSSSIRSSSSSSSSGLVPTTSSSRADRATVNQAVFDALLRDDMENVVMPSTHDRKAAKLLEQGFNPDGTPLSMKQIQRMNQRNKKKTGKAFKLRKTVVPMHEVQAKTGGKSSDSAVRLGVFHG